MDPLNFDDDDVVLFEAKEIVCLLAFVLDDITTDQLRNYLENPPKDIGS
eukprot:gene146-1754_t